MGTCLGWITRDGRRIATAARITDVDVRRKIRDAHQKSAFPAVCIGGK
jgi:hypothetical protein